MSQVTKRKVSTDALETLGTIIDECEKRDAIHLAVLPAVASKKLWPGDSIRILDGVAEPDVTGLAIVDPFLTSPVTTDQRFWAILKPRLVTSLRHVWTHPEFPDTSKDVAPICDEELDPKTVSRRWIEKFAASLDQTYNRLMSAAEDWADGNEYTYDNSETYKDRWDTFPEFWDHWEIVTGRKLEGERESFFTCSC